MTLSKIIGGVIDQCSFFYSKEVQLAVSYREKLDLLQKEKGILKIFSFRKKQDINHLIQKIDFSESRQRYLTSTLLSFHLIRSISFEIQEELLSFSNDVYLKEKDYISLKKSLLLYQNVKQEIAHLSSQFTLAERDVLTEKWISTLLEILYKLKEVYWNHFDVPVEFFSIPIDLSILSMNKKELWLFSISNGYEYEIYNQLYYFYAYLKEQGYFGCREIALEDTHTRKKGLHS